MNILDISNDFSASCTKVGNFFPPALPCSAMTDSSAAKAMTRYLVFVHTLCEQIVVPLSAPKTGFRIRFCAHVLGFP